MQRYLGFDKTSGMQRQYIQTQNIANSNLIYRLAAESPSEVINVPESSSGWGVRLTQANGGVAVLAFQNVLPLTTVVSISATVKLTGVSSTSVNIDLQPDSILSSDSNQTIVSSGVNNLVFENITVNTAVATSVRFFNTGLGAGQTIDVYNIKVEYGANATEYVKHYNDNGTIYAIDPNELNTLTDRTAQIQKILTQVGNNGGGTVVIPTGKKVTLSSAITVPFGVHLTSDNYNFGGITAPLNIFSAGLIYLSGSATINLSDNSKASNLNIIKSGITAFTQTKEQVDAWTGNGITILTDTADVTIENCFIMGFEYGIINSGNASRVHISRCNIDCRNGIYLQNSLDVCYIDEIHCWPWATAQSTEVNDAKPLRNGTAISLGGSGHDWTKISRCFNYGYGIGYALSNSDKVFITDCGSDHNGPQDIDNSTGFYITGTCFNIIMTNCNTASKRTGFLIDTTHANNTVLMTNCSAWQSRGAGIVLNAGNLVLTSPNLYNNNAESGFSSNGINITGATNTARLFVNGGVIIGMGTGIFRDISGAGGFVVPKDNIVYSNVHFASNANDTFNLYTATGTNRWAQPRLLASKQTGGTDAPGAGFGELRWETGAGGSLNLVAYSGTSTTGVTIATGVGAGN